jgi:hypothetical protein
MAKNISCIFTPLATIIFSFLVIEKAFSQIQENKIDTTSNVTTVPNKSSAYVKGITAMRARALAGVVLGLSSLIIGWRAKRSLTKGSNNSRNGAILALVLGSISFILSVIHLSITAGAVFGSGSGKAGAIVAIVLSLIGITFGGLALRANNKTASNN